MERKTSFDARWIVAALALLAAWQGARLMRKICKVFFVLFWIWFGTHGVHWLHHGF